MNLNMIRPKVKHKIYYYQKLKTVKRLSNKLKEKQKKHWNLK